jgi:hypothetical protein
MIDHPRKIADLLAKLQAALPVPATVTQYLAQTLRKKSPEHAGGLLLDPEARDLRYLSAR